DRSGLHRGDERPDRKGHRAAAAERFAGPGATGHAQPLPEHDRRRAAGLAPADRRRRGRRRRHDQGSLRRPMLLDEIFKVALQAIRANKLRSLLTALGIIIGVGAVITMLALGSGAQKAVQDRIAAMGPDLLSIYPGQNFRGGIAFQVIGVLSTKGSAGGFGNPDEQILIPLQTARYRVIGTDRLRTITAQIQNMPSMNLALIEIERVLRRQHHIRPGNDNDFQIRNPSDILATFEQTTQTFKLLLAVIAAVS